MNRSCAVMLLALLAVPAGPHAVWAQETPGLPGGECREGRLSKEALRLCDPHDLLFRRPDPAVPARAPAVSGPAVVSFTTLGAPKSAKRAYEKAGRELGRKPPNFAKAGRYLEEAVALYPRFVEAWQRLGETRFALNDFPRAEQALRTALAADPKYPSSYLLLTEMQLRLARTDLDNTRLAEAARLTDQVLALHPGMSLAHYYRAIANLGLGNGSELEASIHAIIDNREDRAYPGVRAMLAELRAAQGHVQSAVAEYRRFLELEPNSPAADEARARLAEWQSNGQIR